MIEGLLYSSIILKNINNSQKEVFMSDYAVQQFFRKESLLSISLGQDGLLGFFADNYPTVIAMARAIQDQEEKTIDRKRQSYSELEDLRDDLSYYDRILSVTGQLSDSDKERYSEIQMSIEFHEDEIEREDPIFFRGEPLRMCAEYEFLQKLDLNFPGMSIALCEFDRLLRVPFAGWVAKGLGWASTPVRIVVGTILQHTNLGVAGNLIYMLVANYPQIIEQRMQAEMPTGKPVGYPDHEIDGYGIKEKKHEETIKYNYGKKDDD